MKNIKTTVALSIALALAANAADCAGYLESIGGKALVHGHCHHKSLFGMAGEMALLKRLGISAHSVETGCCGMAGAFGFNPRHYDVSVKAGEAALLPAVRAADEHTMIVASGYSCREQIAQLTDRDALHVAEVVALALNRARDRH